MEIIIIIILIVIIALSSGKKDISQKGTYNSHRFTNDDTINPRGKIKNASRIHMFIKKNRRK